VERRVAKRTRRRLTCELRFEGKRAGGIVLDVSETGVFVQTAATPEPGTVVELHVNSHGGLPAMQIRARVARQKRVDKRLVSIESNGLGLQILDAPEVYYRDLVCAVAPKGRQVFTVRASLGPRTRSIRAEARSEDDARAQVLAKLGGEWEILEVKPA